MIKYGKGTPTYLFKKTWTFIGAKEFDWKEKNGNYKIYFYEENSNEISPMYDIEKVKATITKQF